MNIFITLDYEIFFGKNSGTQEQSIINPTNEILKVLDYYHVKASFFIDSGYLLKLSEYRKKFDVLEVDFQKLTAQIKSLSDQGHDIQLHIHPHWEDSYFDGAKWVMNLHRYRLHEFNDDEIDDIVFRYKKVLTDIVGDKVFSYRAGGWCIQPFDKIKNALKKHNIWLDSTVFKNGFDNSKTHWYDFKDMPNKSIWKFENDPLIEHQGFFTEMPISGYKVSPLFFWKLAFYKKFGSENYKSFGDGSVSASKLGKLIKRLLIPTNSAVSIDDVKVDFLEKAFKLYKKEKLENFVIIGHPKAMSKYSLIKFEEFISKNRSENFTTYLREFENEQFYDI
jgi:hypothetical protein